MYSIWIFVRYFDLLYERFRRTFFQSLNDSVATSVVLLSLFPPSAGFTLKTLHPRTAFIWKNNQNQKVRHGTSVYLESRVLIVSVHFYTDPTVSSFGKTQLHASTVGILKLDHREASRPRAMRCLPSSTCTYASQQDPRRCRQACQLALNSVLKLDQN